MRFYPFLGILAALVLSASAGRFYLTYLDLLQVNTFPL
jgi:hypothetical protein